jgi:hypothetical protein
MKLLPIYLFLIKTGRKGIPEALENQWQPELRNPELQYNISFYRSLFPDFFSRFFSDFVNIDIF